MEILASKQPWSRSLDHLRLVICLMALPSLCFCAEPDCDLAYPDQASRECGDVEPMAWVISNSETEMGATDNRSVSVTGGKEPYSWTIEGNGFFFTSNGSLKAMSTSSPSATILTYNACGSGRVTITDACGFGVSNAVRSISGKWTEGCRIMLVTVSPVQPYGKTLLNHIGLSADRCSWYRSSNFFYGEATWVSVEAWPQRWSEYGSGHWVNDSSRTIYYGSLPIAEWQAALAQIKNPVYAFGNEPPTPTGDGSDYECGGSVCKWICQ